MTKAVFAFPGALETRTGGYIYDRRVIELLPACGVDVARLQLPASFPFPSPHDLAQTQRLLSQVSAEQVLLVDGLAWGAIPPAIARAIPAAIIALCHHPLGLEAGLSAAQSAALIENERAVLNVAAHVIVTSAATAQTLIADFGVAREKITIAEPGTERAPRARGSTGAPVLLAVGSIVPRKGYDVLADAMAMIADRESRLVIAGSSRDRAFAEALRARIDAADLHGRITLAGELDDEALARAYDGADIFVSASHYEGYGMVLTEALARGLPIVTTTGGAAATTGPDDVALKVPPGDAPALAAALRRLIDDGELRARLADNAWMAAGNLPHWQDTAKTIAGVIERVNAARPVNLIATQAGKST